MNKFLNGLSSLLIIGITLFTILIISFMSSQSHTTFPGTNSSTEVVYNTGMSYLWEKESLGSGIIKYKGITLDLHTFVFNLSNLNAHIARYSNSNEFFRYNQFIELLAQGNLVFIDSFREIFVQFDSKSVFFECIPVTKETYTSQIFEFVLLPSEDLESIEPDIGPFSEHFSTASNKLITSFKSLKKDATLVVPCPKSDVDINTYSQISNFMRNSEFQTIVELCRLVGSQVQLVLLDSYREPKKKLWLSTSGLGVYWLHIRLDERPKYYNYEPYKL